MPQCWTLKIILIAASSFSKMLSILENPNAMHFGLATLSRTATPFHSMPHATPVGLRPTGFFFFFSKRKEYRLIVLKDISHCTGIGMRRIWSGFNVSWNDVGVLDWDRVMHAWLDNRRRVAQWLSQVHQFCSVRNEILNHQIPVSDSGNIVQAETCIERNDF